MKIILICGKARSGKDTLAKFMKEALDVNESGAYFDRTLVRGNAQSVKDIAYNLHNWNGEKDATGRQLLLDITEKGYKQDPNFWEKETFTQAIMHQQFENKNLEYVIIPDWRYAQTKEYFEKVADKLITIKVIRHNNEEGTHANHPSEMDYNNFEVDHVIWNDSDVTNLKRHAKKIVARL